MSHIGKLITRAVTDDSLENNQIGKYIITPQHGANIYVYHIYKVGAKRRYSGFNPVVKTHIITVVINPHIDVKITYNDYASGNDVVNIHTAMKDIYVIKVKLEIEE